MTKRNKTLKRILDVILYENPSTQDEIAEKLGISRRYVTQLLQPLVKDGTVKRAYMIDLKSYEHLAESISRYSYRTSNGNVLINDMLGTPCTISTGQGKSAKTSKIGRASCRERV